MKNDTRYNVHVKSLNGTRNIYRENWKYYIQCITENKFPDKQLTINFTE